MTRKIQGGSLHRVKQVSDPDGLEGKVAIPVHGFEAAERDVLAGQSAMPVYIVSEAQIQSGEFSLLGGASLPVINVDITNPGGEAVSGGRAVPVYVVSGSLAAVTQTYTEKLLSIQPANLIAYWPLNEASGTTADNAEGTAARDGTYNSDVSGWPPATGIGDGNTAPTFDGVNDAVNIYSGNFQSNWNPNEGTIVLWINSSDWTRDNAYALSFFGDSNNLIGVFAPSGNNTLFCTRRGAGTTKTFVPTIFSTNNIWYHIALVFSVSGDYFRLYINGVQFGSDLTSIGINSGALQASRTVLGAAATPPAQQWSGKIAHVAHWSTPLSESEIVTLSTI